MNGLRPFVVLPFPQKGQARVNRRHANSPTNAGIVHAKARPLAKRDRAIRFFQDIHGLVHSAGHRAPEFVLCANGRGVPADQTIR